MVEVGLGSREVGAERREEDENLAGEADRQSQHHRLRQAEAPERPRERAEEERGEERERHDAEDVRALGVGNARGSENEPANRKENEEYDDELYPSKVRAHEHLRAEAISIVEWPLSATSVTFLRRGFSWTSPSASRETWASRGRRRCAARRSSRAFA